MDISPIITDKFRYLHHEPNSNERQHSIYLFHTTFEGLVKAVLRKLLIDSNVWYVFIPSAILVIFSGVIIPMLLYRFVLKKHRITKLLFGL